MPLKVDVPTALLRGDVDEGYGPMADAFRRNSAERGEVGAAWWSASTGHSLHNPRLIAGLGRLTRCAQWPAIPHGWREE